MLVMLQYVNTGGGNCDRLFDFVAQGWDVISIDFNKKQYCDTPNDKLQQYSHSCPWAH